MIAGRCECGQVMEWVAKRPDDHMRCWGLRWCAKCGDAAPFRGRCRPCTRILHNAYIQRRLLDPFYRLRRNQQARQWEARQRRLGTAAYRRDKERKRLRYATDPAHAQAKRDADRRRRMREVAA